MGVGDVRAAEKHRKREVSWVSCSTSRSLQASDLFGCGPWTIYYKAVMQWCHCGERLQQATQPSSTQQTCAWQRQCLLEQAAASEKQARRQRSSKTSSSSGSNEAHHQ